VYSTIQDLLDHKKTEEALKESEATIRLITESSIDHIMLVDLDFKLRFINRVELGFTKEQLLGKPIYIFLPFELQNRVKGYYEEVIETRKPKTHEMYMITPDGHRIDYESIAAPLVVNNKVTGLIINSRDITERKEAEKVLKQVDNELHLSDELLKQMPDSILLVDEQKRITRWMGSSEKIFGYTAEEAIGQLVSFIHKYPEIQHDIDSVLNISGEYYGEVLCLRKDGSEVPIELTAKVVHNKDGKPIATIGINRDISVRKKAEKAHHEYLAYQANFVYMTSHELRTPLTVIRGYADFLRKNYESLDLMRVQQSLEAIVKSAERLETLITDVKDLSLLEKELYSLDLEEFNFYDFINEIITNYKIILKEQIQFLPFPTSSPIVINGDRVRLQQVFDNLISNAMKFTSEEFRKITVTLERVTNIVRVIISDNGAGIESENMDVIFNQFTSFDTEYAVKGTGIGLYIAKEIIDDHGGNIYVESKGKGKGSTFFVEIPIITSRSNQN
jgi:PAS domain S-box-containing protein